MKEEDKASKIVECLCKRGWEAYIAGGAARDILSGEKPNDYDVVTNATYDVIKTVFEDWKTSVVGSSFKICIVDGVEVATYRKDINYNSLDEDTSFEYANSITEDLSRRDLTINAMAFCPYNGDIVDEYGGVQDLKKRIIRFTRNAEERILEDPCRIIRACRFLAKLEGRFDPNSLEALKRYSHFIKTKVAPERIRLEILKALRYFKPSIFFDALHQIGALKYISPGFESCYGHLHGKYHAENIDEHIKIVGDYLPTRKPLLRLAGYWHDHGKPIAAKYHDHNIRFIGHAAIGAEIAFKELTELKFSQKEVKYVQALTRHHMRTIHMEDKPKTVRKILKKLKDDKVHWKDWLHLKMADTKGNLKKENYKPQEIKKLIFKIRKELKPSTAFNINDLALNGGDVMEILHIKSGPQVGQILKSLLDHVLDNPEVNTRDKLIRLVLKKYT